MNRNIFLVWFIFGFLALFFHFNPHFDIYVSSLFYEPKLGFYLAENPVVKGIYLAVKFMCAIFLIVTLWYAFKIYKATRSYKVSHYLPIIYILLVVIIGPGLLVHEVVKEIYNRPRPRQVEIFGGTEQFQSAFTIMHTDKDLYSFVSGHAAAGFMFFSIAFLMSGKRRVNMFIFSVTFGSFIGFIRIVQGGHFLSDIVFSGFLIYFTAYYLYMLIQPNKAV